MPQPRDHEIGPVLHEHRALRNTITRMGNPAMTYHQNALARLRKKLAAIDFEGQRTNERKNTWLMICHRFVKGLKADLQPLLKKDGARKAAERANYARQQRLLAARRRVQKRRARVRAFKNRLANRKQRRLSVPVKKGVWTTSWQRRLASRPLFRWMKSTADPAVAAAKAKRLQALQQSRQELRQLRSAKRMRLFLRQKKWLRRSEESGQAGDDLWQEMESYAVEQGASRSVQAWPNLRKKQSSRLAGAVEAFVRGGR